MAQTNPSSRFKSRTVIKVKYKKDIKKVEANLKYIGFRSREAGEEQERFIEELGRTTSMEKGFFDAEVDKGADYKSFLQKVQEHPSLQHSATVKVHTMILSLRGSDYRELLQAGGNLKDLARSVVKDLEEKKGMKLEWIGALHEKAKHPHVHLSIMSVGQDAQGKNRRLYINKEDIEWMRERFDKKLESYVPLEQNQDRTQARNPAEQVGKALNKVVDTTMKIGDGVENAKTMSKASTRRRQRRAKSREQIQKEAMQQQPPMSHS